MINPIEKDKFGTPLYYQDFNVMIESGLIPNFKSFVNIGEAVNVGTTKRTVWNDDSVYIPPESAIQMTISSTSANDTAGGTGLRSVTITYLDSTYATQTETILLNGQTPVTTVASMIRINSMIATLSTGTVGSTGSNVGTVYLGVGTVTAGVPVTKYSLMPPTRNVSRVAFYTIPLGETQSILNNIFSSVGNKEAIIDFEFSLFGTDGLFVNIAELVISDTLELLGPNLLGFGPTFEKTDIRINVAASAATVDIMFLTTNRVHIT